MNRSKLTLKQQISAINEKFPNMFTKEEINGFLEKFSMYDKNQDGVISSGELGNALRKSGLYPSKSTLQNMIDAIDANSNGVVDIPEFVSMLLICKEHEKDASK